MSKKLVRWGICLGLLVGLGLIGGGLPVLADGPVVHAVMFYSPSCGHCHHVISEVLPPLLEQYGDQFNIVGVNVAEVEGQALYQAAIKHFDIPTERHGVPTLVIGETALVGSGEIPDQLPGLIETHLAQGGLDWPAIPGLVETMAAVEQAPAETATAPAPATAPAVEATADVATPVATAAVVDIPGVVTGGEDWRARFARDPLGNGISVAVLLGMVVSLLYNGAALSRTPAETVPRHWQWAVPPLVALGLVVAGYLAYVETQQVAAICGPVGDCNAVQQSEFALLFDFLPIAVLGLMGYVGIGAAWAVARFGSGLWGNLAKLALVGMTWFGVAFSVYLTFLEPFVIGATCAWCLTSAVLMTLLFWIIAPLARPVFGAIRTQSFVTNAKI